MRLGHFLDAGDPVFDQAVVVVGHGSADATALVVTAHDHVLDLISEHGDVIRETAKCKNWWRGGTGPVQRDRRSEMQLVQLCRRVQK